MFSRSMLAEWRAYEDNPEGRLPAKARTPDLANVQREMFAALRSINIPEEQAIAVTAAMSGTDVAMSTMAADIATLKADVASIKPDMVSLATKVVLMQWMLGTLIAGVAALVLKAYAH
jgi:hypothetical protein